MHNLVMLTIGTGVGGGLVVGGRILRAERKAVLGPDAIRAASEGDRVEES